MFDRIIEINISEGKINMLVPKTNIGMTPLTIGDNEGHNCTNKQYDTAGLFTL